MQGRRIIVIGLDDICKIFRDYVGELGFPPDALPVKLMMNPQERKLAVVVESDEFTGPQRVEDIKFDLRRVYGVGGFSPPKEN